MAIRKKHHDKGYKKDELKHSEFMPYLNRFLEANDLDGLSKQTQKRHQAHVKRFILWSDE